MSLLAHGFVTREKEARERMFSAASPDEPVSSPRVVIAFLHPLPCGGMLPHM
jgi:hypothetical protein